MNCIKKSVFSLTLALAFTLAQAQSDGAFAQIHKPQQYWQPDYAFEHLSQEQGLSYNTVTSFAQDRQGFLWIGTFNGLNRYDGLNFRVFPQKEVRDSAKKMPRNIRLLYTDKYGEIWIVAFNNVFGRFNPRTETYQVVTIPQNTLRRDIINALKEDAAGTLWISTALGLYTFNRQQNKIIPFKLSNPHDSLRLPLGNIEILCHTQPDGTSEERLWITKRAGLVEIDTKRGTATHHDFCDTASLGRFYVGAIAKDSSGFLWCNDATNIYCFHPGTKEVIVRIPKEEYTRKSNFKNPPKNLFIFQTAICTPDGALWFGSYGGLLVLRYQKEPRVYSLELLQNDEANPQSLSGNTIRALFIDKSGVLWTGGEPFGINKYTPYRQKFLLFQHRPFDPNSLSSNYVRGICQAHSGTLWVATHFGGISRYDPQNRIWTRFSEDVEGKIPKKLHLPVNEIWAVYEDSQGVVWAGTRGSGLLRFDERSGGFVQSDLIPNDAIVHIITEDRAGNLLVGMRGNTASTGVYLIPPHRNKDNVRYTSTLLSNTSKYMNGDVLAIFEDSLGDLWIGGAYDLFRLRKNATQLEDKTLQFATAMKNVGLNIGALVTSMLEDREGTMWFSSKGSGIARYDRKNDRFIGIDETNGLPNNAVYGILEDATGRLWISSDAGLACWDRKSNTFRTFTTADGIQGREFNRCSYFKSKTSGMMFFGGTNGLNAFHPDQLPFNPAPPALALTSIKILAEEKIPETLIKTSNEGQQTLMLRHDQNFITFQFAALDFHVPENNQYSYKLEGLDKNWIMSGTRREAVYTSLDPGEYILRVRAANNDGVWNDEGLSLHVVILPPWWQTWWFRGVLILSGLGVIALVIQNYRRRIQRLQEHRRELLLHIEERQRAELEMQRSEEKFRALFETSTLGMVLWQNDGVILEVNAAFVRLLGHERDEVSTLNFWQILGDTNSSSITHSLKQRRAFGPIEQSLSQSNDEKIAVVMYGIAIGNHNEYQDFERVWSVIEDITERKRATDALLRYQLNPHFMFNVLNSVNALMVENQRNAKRMIIQFSSLLRHTLVASTRQTAPLGDEIDAVEHYLAIEKIRFEERLEAVVNADRATLGLNVPVFLVQPLVENAIKYGMQDAQTPLHITVFSRIENEQLCIEVANTGTWLEQSETVKSKGNASNTITNGASVQNILTKKRSTGIGLTNLRKRLEQYYAQSHSMIISEEQGMVRVRITIALKELSQTMENNRVSS